MQYGLLGSTDIYGATADRFTKRSSELLRTGELLHCDADGASEPQNRMKKGGRQNHRKIEINLALTIYRFSTLSTSNVVDRWNKRATHVAVSLGHWDH
jgi:hypothetical protein